MSRNQQHPIMKRLFYGHMRRITPLHYHYIRTHMSNLNSANPCLEYLQRQAQQFVAFIASFVYHIMSMSHTANISSLP